MKIKDKRKAGQLLGRGNISEHILEYAKDIVDDGSYKNAIEVAGKIKVLVEAASFDEYWDEKAKQGERKEKYYLEKIIALNDNSK